MTDASFASLSAALADMTAAVAPSVVAVRSHRTRASGFAWGPDLIVTPDESLADDSGCDVVLPDGTTKAARVLGRDPTTDIALLRVEGAALPQAGLDAAMPRAGALALAVGSDGGEPLAAFGAVALAGPAWRSLRGGDIDARIEIDMRLRVQGEGSLVVDGTGQAFGMAVFGARRRVLVIPAATIARVAAKLERHGRMPRGYLGLGLQPVRTEERTHALMVMSVEAGGPAMMAGVRQGDVLVTLDGKPVPQLAALLRMLGPDSVGTVLRFGVSRGGEPLEIAVTVGERQT